jgi:hypothetical protein
LPLARFAVVLDLSGTRLTQASVAPSPRRSLRPTDRVGAAAGEPLCNSIWPFSTRPTDQRSRPRRSWHRFPGTGSQIAKAAKNAQAGTVIGARPDTATLTFVPVGPLGRNERATAVRQASQREENPVATNTADHRERTALKRVALAGDRHRIGKSRRWGVCRRFLRERQPIMVGPLLELRIGDKRIIRLIQK